MDYDVFISHASEDKDAVARPLALALRQLGYSIWYDEFTLKIGDSLRRSIDAGLAKSRFGVVVLSPAFLKKNWPQYELDGLVQRENIQGQKVILPVWHNVDRIIVATYSPSLADRIAASSAAGINAIADKIANALGPAYANQVKRPLTDSSASRTEANALIIQQLQDGSGDNSRGCLYTGLIIIVWMLAYIPVQLLMDKLASLEGLGFLGSILALILALIVVHLYFLVPAYFIQKIAEKETWY